MKIGFYQFCPVWGDPVANRTKILTRLESLKVGEVDLLVLPELSFSGYWFSDASSLLPFAQCFDEDFFSPLKELCRDKKMALVVGFAEKEEQATPLLYNSSLLILSSGELHRYRKNHLFGGEKSLFSAGNLGFPIFEVAGVKVGLLICFDHMFPEAARTLALKGAELICHSSNLVLTGYANITSQARALENRVYWVLANRFGQEGNLHFSGESRIVDTMGQVLVQAGDSQEELSIVEMDVELARNKELLGDNDLFKDRRVDCYRV